MRELMRCRSCGAELILTNVVPDDTVAVRGVERRGLKDVRARVTYNTSRPQ